MANRLICRLCCKNEASLDIFNKDSTNIDISTKIMLCCANVIIKEGDGLPSLVCVNCKQELEMCYQFAMKCEASDKYLRSKSFTMILQGTNLDDCSLSMKTEIEYQNDDNTWYEDRHIYEDPIEQNPQEDAGVKPESSVIQVKSKLQKRKRSKCRGSGPRECTVCTRVCANQSTLVVHMRCHTNEYLFPCSLCDKKYKDGGSLKRHMSRHHAFLERMRNFICESCGKGFFNKTDLKIHMRTHTGETPYSCTYCSAKFTQLSSLLKHKKRHSGEKDHICSICSKKFWSKQELKIHLGVHSTDKKYNCSICSTQFKHIYNLKKHNKLHLEPHHFICNYCGQNFKFKGNLKLHIERQHSEKSGYCEVCSKHASNLEVHMWRHTGERPLKCELCTQSFYERKGLARHINFKHIRTNQYKCDFEGCSRMFPSQSMLDFHIIKLHGTQIPFPCDRCTRAFYRKSDLVRHKIGTHKENFSK